MGGAWARARVCQQPRKCRTPTPTAHRPPTPPTPLQISDFGLAKHKYQSHMTCHDLRGTLPYMAPELVSNPTQVRGGAGGPTPHAQQGRANGSGSLVGGRTPLVEWLRTACVNGCTPLGRLRAAQVCEKCDVWSMGVVMWEMWTLRVPFHELSAQQILVGWAAACGRCGGAGAAGGRGCSVHQMLRRGGACACA